MTIKAYVLIEAEPARVAELKEELKNMELDGSVIVDIDVVTGPFDLLATVTSPDINSLAN